MEVLPPPQAENSGRYRVRADAVAHAGRQSMRAEPAAWSGEDAFSAPYEEEEREEEEEEEEEEEPQSSDAYSEGSEHAGGVESGGRSPYVNNVNRRGLRTFDSRFARGT